MEPAAGKKGVEPGVACKMCVAVSGAASAAAPLAHWLHVADV